MQQSLISLVLSTMQAHEILHSIKYSKKQYNQKLLLLTFAGRDVYANRDDPDDSDMRQPLFRRGKWDNA